MYAKQKADLICLQETHSEPDTNNVWQNEFGGKTFWSNFTTQARGVAIMIKKNSEVDVIQAFQSSKYDGRIIGIEFKLAEEEFTLINVYAPNEDDPEFWLEVFKLFEEHPGKRIMVGDYNLALNCEIDRSDKNSKNNERAAEVVRRYFEESYMTDIWRDRNPGVQKFTYIRKKPFIGSRLDYIVTEVGITSWITEAKILPSFKTDHSTVLIELHPFGIARGKGYWKLNNQVLYELDYIEKINTVISEIKDRCYNKLEPDETWEMIKMHIICESQSYCRERASNRRLIIDQLESYITKMSETDRDRTESEEKLLQRSILDHDKLMDEKAQGAIFRSGANYYAEGEKSTKYFFQLEKFRAGAKGMSCILLENGDTVSNPKEILKQQFSFFKKLYTSDPDISFDYNNESNIKLSMDQQAAIEGEFTTAEVHESIFGLKRGSSPGCDGLTSEFFCIFFSKIKDILTDAFNCCYLKGKLYDSARRGVINLIPKKGRDSRAIKNTRPISILCTDYKVIEKVLANRIKPMLEFLINEDQKGFMTGRRISCNIRRVLEVLKHVDEEDLAGVIVSIDFEKCFDRIETTSILGALEYFNFGPSYMQWTKMLYNQPLACIANNGYFSPYFEVTRSVRQGGPNSAYYFLVIAEVLAIELLKNKDIKGFMVQDIMKVLGQYADDLDLYLIGNQNAISAAFRVISIFERKSGFKISYEKSTIYRVGSIKKTQVKYTTQSSVNWTNDGINILGVEVTEEKELQVRNYEPLINTISAILSGWRNRNLSLFGKILVINSLIASLFVYKMTVLPIINENYVKKLNEICEQFIWNGRRAKIPLDVLQRKYADGGANLVNFEKKDLALKASWIQIIESDSYLKAFAYKNLNTVLCEKIWDANIKKSNVLKMFKPSFWRDVLIAWSQVNFQVDPPYFQQQILWYNSLLRIQNQVYYIDSAARNGLFYVEQLVNIEGGFLPIKIICEMFNLTAMQCNSIIASIPKHWKEQIKVQGIPHERHTTQYERCKDAKKVTSIIYSMLIENTYPLRRAFDRWSKHYSHFYVAFDEFCELFNNVKKITTSAKLRSFQFRLLHSAVVFNSHLYRWGIKSNNYCTYCELVKETPLHLLAECKITKEIWVQVEQLCKEYSDENVNISPQTIITNKIHETSGHLFNFIALVVKSYLYTVRCKSKLPNIIEIRKYVEKLQRYEYYYAIKNNKIDKHCKKWCLTYKRTDTENVMENDNEYAIQYILQADQSP